VLDNGPLFTSAGLIEIEGSASSGVRLADRNEADGRIEWQDKLPAPDSGAWLLQDSELALVLGTAPRDGQLALSGYRLDTGSLAWRVSLLGNNVVVSPAPVPVPVPGVLVQPALSVSGCTCPPAGP